MKRGFLNTDKAKKKFHPLTATSPTSASRDSSYAKTLDISKIDQSAVEKMSYGVLKETGPPEGYNKNPGFSVKVMDPHNMLVYTSLPPHRAGQTIKDIPGGWSECLISGLVESTILKTPGFPRPLKKPLEQTYRILEAPGKGLGMFAARKLSIGDLILDERPLLITPTEFPIQGIQSEVEKYTIEQHRQIQLFESEKWLKIAYERMDPHNRKAYMALANCHLHDGCGPLTGVLRTNGFGISDLQDIEQETKGSIRGYAGVFNDLSRLNHSCSPNTIHRWYTKSFSRRLRATRDIDEGEEITTNYAFILDTAANRAADLRQYGIKCTCSACSNPKVFDARRERYSLVLNSPMRVKPGERGDSFLDTAIGLLKDMEEDSMQATEAYKVTLDQLVNAYVMLNNAEKAYEYGRKLKGMLLAIGEKPLPYFESLESIRQHPMWMMRKTSQSMGMPVSMSFAG